MTPSVTDAHYLAHHHIVAYMYHCLTPFLYHSLLSTVSHGVSVLIDMRGQPQRVDVTYIRGSWAVGDGKWTSIRSKLPNAKRKKATLLCGHLISALRSAVRSLCCSDSMVFQWMSAWSNQRLTCWDMSWSIHVVPNAGRVVLYEHRTVQTCTWARQYKKMWLKLGRVTCVYMKILQLWFRRLSNYTISCISGNTPQLF